MTEPLILTTAYFGPVQYYTKFIDRPAVRIEQHDNYIKQTYRNRCTVGSANGPLSLIVPVKRRKGEKTTVKDIKIDYDTNWRKDHRQGIISSYNSSPFFEYIRDEIEPFFFRKYEFLIDMNFDILIKTLECLEIECNPELTSHYDFNTSSYGAIDLRDIIHPKKHSEEDLSFHPVPYTQVFSSKLGFIPNLSILDLLFNTGKEAKSILKASMKISVDQAQG